MLSWTNPVSNPPPQKKNSSWTDILLFKNTCEAMWGKQVWSHIWISLMDSHSWMCQCWLTSKALPYLTAYKTYGCIRRILISAEQNKKKVLILNGIKLILWILSIIMMTTRGVRVKAMDCGIVVSEFELQSFTFGQISLGKGMNPLIPPAMDLIVPLLFF